MYTYIYTYMYVYAVFSGFFSGGGAVEIESLERNLQKLPADDFSTENGAARPARGLGFKVEGFGV